MAVLTLDQSCRSLLLQAKITARTNYYVGFHHPNFLKPASQPFALFSPPSATSDLSSLSLCFTHLDCSLDDPISPKGQGFPNFSQARCPLIFRGTLRRCRLDPRLAPSFRPADAPSPGTTAELYGNGTRCAQLTFAASRCRSAL